MKYPIIITGLLLITALAITEALRVQSLFAPDCMRPQRAYHAKMNPSPKPNIIFAGNSRTETGLVPEIVDSWFPENIHFLNFAFSSQELSDAYFSYIENLLDSPAQCRVVVMNISNINLRVYNPDSCKIHSYFEKNPYPDADNLPYIEKLGKNEFPLFQNQDRVLHLICHRSGWIEMDLDTFVSRYSLETNLEKAVDTAKLAENISENEKGYAFLARWIPRWRAQNITVIFFQAPTDAWALKREKRMGYSMEKTRNFVQNLGALWIDVDQTRYFCCDHSHLNGTSAREFSRDFAPLLLEKLRELKILPPPTSH